MAKLIYVMSGCSKNKSQNLNVRLWEGKHEIVVQECTEYNNNFRPESILVFDS